MLHRYKKQIILSNKHRREMSGSPFPTKLLRKRDQGSQHKSEAVKLQYYKGVSMVEAANRPEK